ncbi:hypothetical protein V6N11_046208 [Hibiscus sabdariffa]|uniref:Reverse transcriptase zinc-binding domain-containing protein n=2 Tax=Hibiscus sabdariffa TaxID=183260 RepID=A0ABR1ZG66_9ROSI
MVDHSGSWNWSRLTPWLAGETLEKIAAAIPPRVGVGVDVPGWRWEDNHKFTTRSAYTVLTKTNLSHGDSYWGKIWRLPVSQCIRTFIWLVFHRRLLTNEERARRHLTSSPHCTICGDSS